MPDKTVTTKLGNELADAIEENFIVWANTDKQPGWCKRVSASDRRCHNAVRKWRRHVKN